MATGTLGQINTYVGLATALEPLLVPVVEDIANLFKAHPAVTIDQWVTMLTQLAKDVHAENADTLSTVAADEAANPLPPAPPPAPPAPPKA